MISRRLLRVKALQILYAYKTTQPNDLINAEKELLFSIKKSYELYHLMLLLLVDLSDYARERIEIARSKYFPTEEEANPNRRFIENRVVEQIRRQKDLFSYVNNNKTGWVNQQELIKKLYSDLIQWDGYRQYMNSEEDGFIRDRTFVIKMVAGFLLQQDNLSQVLEEMSIYWNDDLDFIGAMVIKTLERTKESSPPKLLSMYKNEEDRHFVLDLFHQTVFHTQEYEDLIREYTRNWDFDRLALMDILIMELAITEAVHFTNIPVKVTLNEYIEISKYYSTDKSNLFINGILDKIFSRLRTEKKIVKTGRGLIGET